MIGHTRKPLSQFHQTCSLMGAACEAIPERALKLRRISARARSIYREGIELHFAQDSAEREVTSARKKAERGSDVPEDSGGIR
jgi:hypothetical protein